jgi:hypothetical protein
MNSIGQGYTAGVDRENGSPFFAVLAIEFSKMCHSVSLKVGNFVLFHTFNVKERSNTASLVFQLYFPVKADAERAGEILRCTRTLKTEPIYGFRRW